jgi:hypothetical protein
MQNKKLQREQMMAMIEDWQSSGLNQSAYCAAKKIGYSTFHYWYGLYRKKKTETGLFLPVKVMSSISNEQITIIGVSGIKLEVSLTEKSIGFVKQLLLD